MSRMILVPIDISDKEFTERIISHVESEARIDDAEVHFPHRGSLLCPIMPHWEWPIPLSFPAWTSCVRVLKRN